MDKVVEHIYSDDGSGGSNDDGNVVATVATVVLLVSLSFFSSLFSILAPVCKWSVMKADLIYI